MAIAQTTFGSVSNIWADHRLSRELKLRTYQLAVCSTWTHSSEAWTLTAAVMRSINGFNSRCIHVITGQDYRHTATAPVFDLVRAIRQRRLRYLGHIMRMPESRVVRRALVSLTVTGTQSQRAAFSWNARQSHSRTLRRAAWNTMVNPLPYMNNNINFPLLPLDPVGLIWMSYIHPSYFHHVPKVA